MVPVRSQNEPAINNEYEKYSKLETKSTIWSCNGICEFVSDDFLKHFVDLKLAKQIIFNGDSFIQLKGEPKNVSPKSSG